MFVGVGGIIGSGDEGDLVHWCVRVEGWMLGGQGVEGGGHLCVSARAQTRTRAQTRAPGIPSLLIPGATSSRFFKELSVPPPLRVSFH